MSYLPEAEVLRKELEKEVVGKRVKDATVRTAKLVARHRNRPDFVGALEGRKIEGVRRRGTWLVLDLDDGAALVLGLGARTHVERETANAEAGPRTQAVVRFTTGGALHVVDPANEAELFVTAEAADLGALLPGGVDPLSGTFTWHTFGQRLVAQSRPLKAVLVDESFVLGLGDLYADEVLWTAGLAGTRPSTRMSSQEVRRLYRALFEVIHEAIKQGGEPHADEEEDDEPPAGSGRLNVHGRAGRPCPRCRNPIAELDAGEGLRTFACTSCQN